MIYHQSREEKEIKGGRALFVIMKLRSKNKMNTIGVTKG